MSIKPVHLIKLSISKLNKLTVALIIHSFIGRPINIGCLTELK